jgi:putative ABC transport system permease protein
METFIYVFIMRSLLDTQHLSLLRVAFKMLVNSRKKFIGMLIGATFSAFIIMQQPGIYKGVTDRIVAQVRSITEIDLWVMGKDSHSFDLPKSFTPSDFYRVRSVPGVLWAVQLYRTWYLMKHPKTNQVRSWELVGVDPYRLIGLPKTMVAGERETIHRANALIVDGYSLKQMETDAKETVAIGDKMYEGRNTWTITGIAKPLRSYMYQPKVYMASNHIPNILNRQSFILVKVKPGADVQQVAAAIEKKTHFDALTPEGFQARTLEFFRKKTPIVINFITVAILGFIIGLVVMWQIFSNFILTHLHQFGMLKMLGVSNSLLKKMVFFQAGIVGIGGYIFALLLAILFGFVFYDTIVAFHLTWRIAVLGFVGALVIVILSSYFSMLKVIRMDTVELCRDLN